MEVWPMSAPSCEFIPVVDQQLGILAINSEDCQFFMIAKLASISTKSGHTSGWFSFPDDLEFD